MVRNGITRQFTVVLLCLAFAIYFGFHAIKGRHGFEVHQRLSAKERALTGELGDLEAVLSHLKRDVALLEDEHVDEDRLDEAARSVLGYAATGDVVVLTR